jgi:hypothetical protein
VIFTKYAQLRSVQRALAAKSIVDVPAANALILDPAVRT